VWCISRVEGWHVIPIDPIHYNHHGKTDRPGTKHSISLGTDVWMACVRHGTAHQVSISPPIDSISIRSHPYLTSPGGCDDHDRQSYYIVHRYCIRGEGSVTVKHPAEARHGNCIDRTSSSSPGGWKGGVGQVVSKYGCSP